MMKKEMVDLVAEAMRAGGMPWRAKMTPTNPWTKDIYHGMNVLLLNVTALRRGYKSQWWASYQQWGYLGCQVKKRPEDIQEGTWATAITRWDVKKPVIAYLFNAEQVFGRTIDQWNKPVEFVPATLNSEKMLDLWQEWFHQFHEQWALAVEIAHGLADKSSEEILLPVWLKKISEDPNFLTEAVNKAFSVRNEMFLQRHSEPKAPT